MDNKKGMVYIVGAGPGDPKLFTLRGAELLKRADVVLYDYLAPKSLLGFCRDDCEKIYVGKSAGRHTKPQSEINRLLAEKAKEGLTVARLKGGDPFVFARGGEEAEFLKENGVPFEIVPGITASIAGPAYAGIPVTHRDFTRTFTLVTGHESDEKGPTNIRWKALADLGGTIALYMGVKNLRSNLASLIENGMAKDTPAAFIRWATTSSQKTFVGTIEDLDKAVPQDLFKPPAMIVVGEVVGLRESLKWFEKRPLLGRSVLVTRARTKASSIVSMLSDLGANCVELPTIRIEEPLSYGELDSAINNLSDFDWIIFTSANGAESFKKRLADSGRDARHLGGLLIGSIGPATTEALLEMGIRPDFEPRRYDSKSILSEIGQAHRLEGKKILLPRSDIAPKELEVGLRDKGAEVVNVTAYRTVEVCGDNKDVREMIDGGRIDCITFSSSSTVRNFFKWYGAGALKSMNKIDVASIGPVTTDTLKGFGLAPNIVADESTVPSLVKAVKDFYA